MSLCPEAAYRDSLSDAEFWEHVFGRHHEYDGNGVAYDQDDPDHQDQPTAADEWGLCPLCGEPGACAYDVEGQPMRHVTTDREDS